MTFLEREWISGEEKVWKFLSEAEGASQFVDHFHSAGHLYRWYTTGSPLQSRMGAVKGTGQRHRTAPMRGNSPWAVPIRVSGEVGTQRLLRLPTLEGCVLPVHDAVLRNLGDTRMLMLNVWQAAKQRRVVTRGSKSGTGGLCVVSKDIKSMQAGLVRWSTSELTSRYDALGIRYTSLEHCPRSATEYFSRCGLRLPTATDGLVLPDWVLGERRRDAQSTPESDLQPGAALSNVPLPAENHGGTVELAAPIVKKKEIRGADYLDFMRPASLKAGWFSVARID